MIFNSVSFGIFFPIAVIIYFLIPSGSKRGRIIWLLLSSLYFYLCQGAPYVFLLLISIGITYTGALFLKGKKWVFVPVLVLNLSILFIFKYFGFFTGIFGIKTGFDLLLPVGISFYIFKSTAYLIDVYRGDIPAERDLLKYSLFVSFFPEILSGPISRAPSLLPQFDEPHDFDYERIRAGLLRMLWGYFIKLAIASRLSIAVDLIYNNAYSASGIELLFGSLLYSVQVYCDFMGYSEIAIGAGQVIGITLSENFNRPFLAPTLADLWRRWHMSLMSWFKDYLYIPLGGNRKGTVRKYINILIVFTLSGLWHGAAFHYVLWGFLSGLLQVIGSITSGIRKAAADLFPVKNAFTDWVHAVYKRVAVFLLFTFTVVFFRAPDVKTAFDIIVKIFTDCGPASISAFNPFKLGLGTFSLFLTFGYLLCLLIAGLVEEKEGGNITLITKKNVILRWGVYFFLTCSIIASANIGAEKFIYFEF